MKVNKILVSALAFSFVMSFLTSCGGDDEAPSLPPIGGYNNSDEVSASNLIAKWSFENNITESKNNLTGIPNNVGYAAGAKGQAWQGSDTQNRYAVFNGANAIGALNSFSFSFWINTANTVAPSTPGQGKGAQGIFTLVKPTEFWGAMNLFLENPDSSKPNRFLLKLLVENKRTGVVWQSQSPVLNVDDKLNTWVHIAYTYNAATSRISAYVNGALASSVSGPYSPTNGYPGSFILYANDPGSAANINGAPLWGNIDFGGTFNQVVLGSHQFETTPSLTSAHGQEDWATSFVGKLDEFRIYKASLALAEINSIYELEKAGR
jgi:hypothetical protein